MNHQPPFFSTIKGITGEKIKNQLADWLSSPELGDLVTLFGGNWHALNTLALTEKAQRLAEFSVCWDYRKQQKQCSIGNEKARWLLQNSEQWDLQTEKRILKNCFSLGLKGSSQPAENYYDYVLVLGGIKSSCYYRTKYALELIKNGIISCSCVAFLGTERDITCSEQQGFNVPNLKGKTEFELLFNSAQLLNPAIKISEEKTVLASSVQGGYRIVKGQDNHNRFLFLNAPAQEPEKRKRANTADTYEFFAQTANMPPDMKLLLITTQIFVPYQQLTAVRLFSQLTGKPACIESVGFPNRWIEDASFMHQPVLYLQELRSALLAARDLTAYCFD